MAEKKTEKKIRPARVRTATEALVTTVAACAALILLNAVSCRSHAKADLTEAKIYSLLPASKQLVHDLDEKLIVRFYVGNVPPEQAQQERYVDNLLSEYADASGGKFVYEKMEVDASDKPEARDRQKELADDGIQRVLLITSKDDKAEQQPAYFHVQFQYLDKKEVWKIPNAFVAEGLEYDFTTIVMRLAHGKKKIGVTMGFGEPEQHKGIDLAGVDMGNGTKLGLTDLYDLTPVDWSKNPKSIDDSLDALIIYGPTAKVSDAALYYLDQYIMKGKPVLVMIPGMTWAAAQQQGQPPTPDTPYVGTPVDPGMKDFLAHYGFQIDQDVVLDRKNAVVGVIPMGGQMMRSTLFFPLVATLENGKNQALQGLRAMVMPYGSRLELVGPLEKGKATADYEVRPLFVSSPQSFTKSDLTMVTRETQIKPTGDHGPYLMGVSVIGKWPSYFAGKAKPEGVGKPSSEDPTAMVSQGDEPTIEASQKPSRMVVAAGAVWAQDLDLILMQSTHEIAYANSFLALHSLVDWATEDTGLLTVRAKQVLRPLDDDLSDSKRKLVKYGNIAGVPLALILFGVVYWQIRERRRRNGKL